MTVLKTNDIALPTAPSVSDAIESAKHAQSRLDSHRGTPCRSRSEKNEDNLAIVERCQQMIITLPDAPLVWQAFRNAEMGFPVDAAQILSGTFDFKACDSYQMADKIAKEVAGQSHNDSSFMKRFVDQLGSVNAYIGSVVSVADEEVAGQDVPFFIWGDKCLVVFYEVLQRISIQLDDEKEQLRQRKEQLRFEKEQLRKEQRRLAEERLLNELDDLFKGLPVQ